MARYPPTPLKAILTSCAVALALVIGQSASFGAAAEDHYFSLKKIFPNGKCSPVVPNYELMVGGFPGGEITKFRIHDDQGKVVEIISTFVNEDRSQGAIVGADEGRAARPAQRIGTHDGRELIDGAAHVRHEAVPVGALEAQLDLIVAASGVHARQTQCDPP